MSKSLRKSSLFVDTRLLRDHVSKLREDKKIASELYENVVKMKSLSDPSVADQYNSILYDINQMIEYFSRMADVLTNIGDNATELSHMFGEMITDDTERARHIISKTFFL